ARPRHGRAVGGGGCGGFRERHPLRRRARVRSESDGDGARASPARGSHPTGGGGAISVTGWISEATTCYTIAFPAPQREQCAVRPPRGERHRCPDGVLPAPGRGGQRS